MWLYDIARNGQSALKQMQRHVNAGSPSGYHSRLPDPYDPMGTSPSFPLPYFDVPLNDSHLHYRAMSVPEAARNTRCCVRIFVHPLMVSRHQSAFDSAGLQVSGHLTASPTSSARTLWLEEGRACGHVAVKLHFDDVLGRIARPITRAAVQHIHNVASALHEATCAGRMPASAGYLDEPFAAFCDWPNNLGIGISYRYMQAKPDAPEPRILIPAHALHSRDRLAPSDPTILEQVIRQRAGDPLEVFIDEIIEPLLSTYIELATELGLAPEAHGQNTYAEFSPAWKLQRYIFQGFESFLYDVEARQRKGLSPATSPPLLKYLDTTDERRFAERSFYFDAKLCGYLIDALVHTIARCFHQPVAHIQALVHEVVAMKLAHVPFKYLPGDGAFFQVDNGRGGSRALACQKPKYRSLSW